MSALSVIPQSQFRALTATGQTLASHRPLLCPTFSVLLWPVSLLLGPLPSVHIPPVGRLHTAEDAPPLTNPIVCPRQSPRLGLFLHSSTGMLLQGYI